MNGGVSERAVVYKEGHSGFEKRKKKSRFVSVYDVAVRMAGILLARAMPAMGVAPFGIAFLSLERRFSWGALVTAAVTAIGYITLWDMTVGIKYISAVLMYLLFLFAAGKEEIEISTPAAIGAAGVVVALSGLGVMIWVGFSLGGILQIVCDVAATAIGSVVFEQNRMVLSGRKSALFTMNRDQKICFAVLIGIVLTGLKDIGIEGYFSAANVAGLWLAAIFVLCGGVTCGTLCGAVTGMIIGAWDNILEVTAVVTACTIAGGAVVKYGKGAVAFAMALCAVAVIMLGAGAMPVFAYADIPLFVIAVIATPDYAVRVIGRISGVERKPSNGERYREYVTGRLDSAASSFRILADTFLDLADRHNPIDIEDISVLFDGVADRVCRECSKVGVCWVSGFNSTYKSMFRMLEIAERRGEVAEEDVDELFAKKCLRLRAVVREMNRLFEIYKINCVWKSKLCENRELAGEQLASVAQILDNISAEICEEKPDAAAETEIRLRLETKNVEVFGLDVTVKPDGKYSAYIEFADNKNLSDSRRAAEGILRAVLGVKMTATGAIETSCGVTVKFTQPEGYLIESGAASVGKGEECGDTCIMRYLSGGKYAAALSDGMGTGRRASRDSSATIRLLGDFLEAGFDRSVAVRLVNSIMVMKSADEAFATVDMCVIDLFDGDTEFIKNGAEPSYIKRNDGVETVRAASLPVGVMQNMEVESFAHRLNDGDIIVMLSDGLQMKKGHEDWIRKMIEDADCRMPPQEMADRIIDMANVLQGGEPQDDMTVMVMKLIER